MDARSIGSSAQPVEVGQHLIGVLGGDHFRIGHGNPSVGADEDRDPARPGGVRLRRAVGDRCRSPLVAQQVIGKSELVSEGEVVGRRIIADAEDDGISIVEVLDSITEPIAFDGSARGVGLGIPPQQDVSAGKIIELHRRPVLVGQREGRCGAAGFDQSHLGPLQGFGVRIAGANLA